MLKKLSSEEFLQLRSFFTDCAYTRDGIRGALASSEVASQRLGNLPRMLYRTREKSTLNTLIRLFSIGFAVESATALETIPEPILSLCVQAGLLSREPGSFDPTVAITPFEQFLVVSDRSLDIEKAKPDIVLGINPTTWLLFRFTMRKAGGAALDLGSGSGAQALAACLHNQRVVATDLNPRATEFAAFNAAFNGIDNMECLTGDCFATVKDRKFDLILANPPFFVTPSNNLTFCENPMDLDLFCRRLVKEAPAHLNEGGYLQMIFEWAEVQGQTWQERLSEWLEGTGLDAWILRGDSEDCADYAHKRIREISSGSLEEDNKRYAEWMAHYERMGVRTIHGGLVALRKRSGHNWVRIEELPIRRNEPYGDSILRGFEARDFLDSHASDEQMVDICPKLCPDAELIGHFRATDRGWTESDARLQLLKGLMFAQTLQPEVAGFLGRMDGIQTLGTLIANFASQVHADPALVQRECLAVVRRLIEHGFLLV